MKADDRLKSLARAFLGLALIVAYFWLFSQTTISALLQFKTPNSEILLKAQEEFESSGLADYELDRSVRINIDESVSHYAQVLLPQVQALDLLPLAQWRVSWRGETETENDDDEGIGFIARYGLDGTFLGFEKDLPSDRKKTDITQVQATALAQNTLAAFDVDSTSVTLAQRKSSEEEGVSNYEFTFTRPSPVAPVLKELYTVAIAGSEVVEFEADLDIDGKQFEFPKIVDLSETVGGVTVAVVWMILGIFILVIFVKRIRHDEIEFRRAIWVGSVVAAIMWAMVAISSWPEWAGVLLGGGFSGLFTGVGMLIAYACTESVARDVWPEKLVLTDLLFRGSFRVKELGSAILNSFFIIGVGLLVHGGLIWLTSASLNFAYLKIDSDSFWLFRGVTESIAALAGNVTAAAFIGVVLVFFWASYLKSKIKNSRLLTLTVALTILLAGLHFIYLRPTYLAVLISLPLALVAANFALKHEMLTILMSVFGFLYFINLSLISLSPERLGDPLGLVTGLVILGLFTTGVVLVYGRRSVKDFAHYVPEYVSRIAERERLLQELEIARGVQMKFLPQSIPEFRGLDIACICRPAMEVGGDYYDFIAEDDRYLNVLIGDVSGKGVSAAFYMTMTAGIFRTLSKRVASPKELLTDLNEVFYEYTPRDVFISAIYGRFDMEEKTLTFARAGHNPVMGWKSLGGETEILDSRGMAVGLENGQLFAATIEEKQISIEPGDLFVFYTDGISEAMNHKSDEFGEDRLEEAITRYGKNGAQTFLNTITNEVSEFVGDAKQHDDLTMVVVKVK